MTAAIARFVRRVMGDLTFERRYPAKVERQNPDGTFDLTPFDPALQGQGLQRVPARVGVAGASLSLVQPGTVCLIGFASGDPRYPEILAWEFKRASGTISLDGGTAGLARKGDLIELLLSASTPIAGSVSGVQTIPGSPPTVIHFVGVPFTGFATIPAPIRGRIIGGKRSVTA